MLIYKVVARLPSKTGIKMKIVVIMAMQSEFSAIKEMIQPAPLDIIDCFPGHQYHQAECFGHDIIFALPGLESEHAIDRIGPQNASLIAYESINYFKPELVINAGTCGGFKARGAMIGDVYLSTEPVFYHDRRIPLDNFQGFASGYFQPSKITFASPVDIKSGRVTTGSSLTASEQDLSIMINGEADCKEMELAAIAYVCQSLDTHWVGIKSVTDIVDCEKHTTEEEFLRNLNQASSKLKDTLLSVLQHVQLP